MPVQAAAHTNFYTRAGLEEPAFIIANYGYEISEVGAAHTVLMYYHRVHC